MKEIKTKREIEELLQSRFGIKADIQVVKVKGEGRTLYLLEHIPVGCRTTVAGLERLCRRICKALDADPYGTVNLDVVSMGESPTFDMMAEVGI
jgi:ribosome maturation factor RimP